jgi:hypothetical protein
MHPHAMPASIQQSLLQDWDPQSEETCCGPVPAHSLRESYAEGRRPAKRTPTTLSEHSRRFLSPHRHPHIRAATSRPSKNTLRTSLSGDATATKVGWLSRRASSPNTHTHPPTRLPDCIPLIATLLSPTVRSKATGPTSACLGPGGGEEGTIQDGKADKRTSNG